jgi:hypothetical protein
VDEDPDQLADLPIQTPADRGGDPKFPNAGGCVTGCISAREQLTRILVNKRLRAV